MATLDRFDVALVFFPFTEKFAQKQRPAIVLTGGSFNEGHRQFVGAMVTTASNTRWASDLTLTDLDSAGLTRPSVMRMKLFSVADDLVVGRIGRLSQADQTAVRAQIEQLFLN